MIRVLIVDDEEPVVNSLYFYILREFEEQVEAYRAYSAAEAVRILQSICFDIVVSDISMPEMDGMDLIEWIKRLWPEIRIVLFTGYDSFEYAYRAMKFDFVNYILKSEGYSRIHECISKEIMAVQKRRKERIRLDVYQGQIRSIEIHDCLHGLMTGREISPEFLSAVMPEIAPSDEVILIYGVFDVIDKTAYEALDLGVGRLLTDSFFVYCTLIGRTLIAVMKEKPERGMAAQFFRAVLENKLEELQEYLNLEHGILASMAYIAQPVKLERLAETAKQLRTALGERILTSSTLLLFECRNNACEHSDSWVVRHLEEYIPLHLSEDLSLIRLAEEVHRNASYLSRIFHEKKGIGLNDYINTLRLEKAKSLLTGTAYKVQEIAERCGYGSVKYFTKVFKEKYWMTPTEYRSKQ